MPRFVTVTDSINKKTYAIEVSSITLVEKDEVSTRIHLRDGNLVQTQDHEFDEILKVIGADHATA